MAFKVVIISCLVALVRAGNIPAAVVAQPVVAAPALARLEELDSFPQYSFGYDVADSLTGDYKSQQESRNGDLVQGRYSLLEADGSTRVVDYTADSVNGFNAVVSKNPVIAEAVVAEAGPVVTAARYVAPVAAAPVAARIAAAPVAAPLTAPVAAPVLPAARYTAAFPPLSPYAAFPAPFARFAYPGPAAPIVAV